MNEFIWDALVADVEGKPAVMVSEPALQGALLSLGQRYPGEFGARLSRVLQKPAGASDADACWAANLLFNKITQLPADHGEALLRYAFGG